MHLESVLSGELVIVNDPQVNITLRETWLTFRIYYFYQCIYEQSGAVMAGFV